MTETQSPASRPKVSVVVATYNRARYLRESLDSILAQSLRPYQILVVDDGSDDATPDIVGSYGPAITYLRKANGGRASATNYAAPHVRGDWLWLFDDDDVALPDSIERRYDALRAHGKAEVAFSGHFVGSDGPDGTLEIRHEVIARPPAAGDFLRQELLNHHLLLPSALMRTNRFLAAGPWNERYLRSSDYEFTVRLLRQAPHVAIVPEPTFIWREHPGARGPTGSRHDGSQREAVWMRFDGMLGLQVRDELALAEYLAPAQHGGELTCEQRQEALLHRMAVMASKGLIAEMLEDLEAFAVERSARRGAAQLNPETRSTCQRAVLRPYFLTTLLEHPSTFSAGLRSIAAKHAVHDVIACFAKGLVYAARHTDRPWRSRAQLYRCALTVAQIAGARELRAAYART